MTPILIVHLVRCLLSANSIVDFRKEFHYYKQNKDLNTLKENT